MPQLDFLIAAKLILLVLNVVLQGFGCFVHKAIKAVVSNHSTKHCTRMLKNLYLCTVSN